MGTGIYIHIPFCPRKCGYCSFNSFTFDPSSAARYVSALRTEISGGISQRYNGETPGTLYIGGGTPTVLGADIISGLISCVCSSCGLAPGAEVTVEANPGTLDDYDMHALARAGVSRVSLGAQSFDADELGMLGRVHGPEDTVRSFELVRRAGIRSLSLDLIYALPGQDLESWKRSIHTALSLAPDHMSLYCLSIDEGTPLHRAVKSGELSPLPESLQADMYHCAVEALGEAGLYRYEISNFARPGHECLHNLNYWKAGDYLGFGAGAHSSIGCIRTVNHTSVEDYVSTVLSGGPAACSLETLTGEDLRKEFIMLSFRTSTGLSFAEYKARYGKDFMEYYALETARLTGAGCLSRGPEGVRLTEKGIFASNAVISEFF